MKWFFERLIISPTITTQLLIASLFINLLGLLSSVYVIQVYGRYLLHGINGTLITLSSGMLIVIILELLLRRIRYRLAMAFSAHAERLSSKGLFSHLLHARTDALLRAPSAIRDVILRKHDQMQSATNPSVFIALIDAPFAFLYIIAIFFISTTIGWSVLFLVLLTLIIIALLSLLLRQQTEQQIEAQQSQSEVISSVARFEMVRATGAGIFLSTAWDNKSALSRWYKYALGRLQDLIQNVNQSMAMLVTLVVIGLGAQEVVAAEIDFGMLIGMNILAARALSLITRPAQSIAPLLNAEQSRKFIDDFKKIPVEIEKGIKLDNFSGKLEFKNVTFGYIGGTGPLFENLSVKIPAGSFVKVIGSNGAGKTTLCRLLTQFVNPRRGMILANDTDIRQFDPQWWREQLIYLPQEPEFIEATLRDNLLLLNNDISDDHLHTVIKQSALDSFINQSADGLDMMIRNNGKEFSLGIRRRMALARALISDGCVVIIDDPTEGLDAQGVQAIASLLNKFTAQKRTIIVMTHDANAINGQGILIDLQHKPSPLITGINL